MTKPETVHPSLNQSLSFTWWLPLVATASWRSPGDEPSDLLHSCQHGRLKLGRVVRHSESVREQYFCWSYDSFGNRRAQVISPNPCSNPTPTTNYDEHNQVTFVSGSLPNGLGYDESGNVKADDANSYLYGAEGRVCAVANTVIPGGAMMQYIYDAEGHRVAKGSITTWSCDTSANGFIQAASYILGSAGEQITEIDGNGNWQHTNVYAAGQLIVTFKNDAPAGHAILAAPHFHLTTGSGRTVFSSTVLGNPKRPARVSPSAMRSAATEHQMQPNTTSPAKNGTLNQDSTTSGPGTTARAWVASCRPIRLAATWRICSLLTSMPML